MPTSIALVLSLAVVLCAGTASAQQGSCVSTGKISAPLLLGHGITLGDGDEFGDAVADLGDLDGAGPSVRALAVGAINDDDGGPHRGAVYILFLDGVGEILSTSKISATQGNFTGVLDFGDEFGSAIASLGDLDGAGPSVLAIAVGVINDDDGGPDHGAVYVLFLNAQGTVIAQQKINNFQGNFTPALDDNDEFGGAVAGLGDLDGAGPSAGALAVGCVYDDDGGLDRGCVYILFLNSAGSVLSTQKIGNNSILMTGQLGDGDNFGEDVCSLGDLDGPGGSARAIAIGSVGDDDGGSDHGSVYIVFLNSAGAMTSRQKISDTQGNFLGPLLVDDNFGTAVVGLGDIDGPGGSATALAVGVAGFDGPGGLDQGAIYVLFLDATGKTVGYQEISSVAGGFGYTIHNTDEFGSGLCALGDLDGSAAGVQTLVCGVGFDDDGGLDRGCVYLMNLAGAASVGVGDMPVLTGIALGAPRPNLFTQRTSIPFRLEQAAQVRIEVRDLAGRQVRTLVDATMGAGEHQVPWDGTDATGRHLSAGAYFVRMAVAGRTVGATKAVLLR
ncbi:MAG TPA: FlgD immunoglobulin-like domain containing protein [Candidatus Eisenbacteria bacterium]|nr:FlgD immunoglobulin-like domain containing protein [Candidatus Eisenbacteria bacterium]